MKKTEGFIPKKPAKGTKISLADTPTSEIPEDLQKAWNAVECIATTCNLLQKGSFPVTYHKAIAECVAFQVRLHQNMVEEALKHPQANLIPELKQELEKAAKDGENQTSN